LQEYGGEHFQGFLFGRPQPPPREARELVQI
jgi:EAL domain-containing protein (putative c-di-GMP-specific phosphodiesterase class I)